MSGDPQLREIFVSLLTLVKLLVWHLKTLYQYVMIVLRHSRRYSHQIYIPQIELGGLNIIVRGILT